MSVSRITFVLWLAVTAAGASIGAQGPPAAQSPPATAQAPRVEERIDVVGTTPIHGVGIDRDKVPGNVQTIDTETLAGTGAIAIGEQLAHAAPSVHINDATTNPFQPDVQLRGFVGSPLLGLPQGLALYQNGVRLNESFGDTVNWDLLPDNAIATIDLIPGSNPMFGLNALGGALSVQTKTGFSHPGHAASVSGGSFGRYMVDGASGGGSDRFSYFVAGRALSEDGWRDASPSRVHQLFGDLAWRRPSTTVNATVTTAFNRLIGNAPAPVQLLESDRAAVFTHPDETDSDLTLLTLRGRHAPTPSVAFDALGYYRRASIRTFNGDDSDYDECGDEDLEGFLCAEGGAGDAITSQFGALIPIAEDEELDAANNLGHTVTDGWGAALQATVVAPLARRPNHFVMGVAIDGGQSRYSADTEIAHLTDDRGTAGTGLFDAAATVRLETSVRHTGIYAADFFTVIPKLTIMGAARINHSAVTLRDQAGEALNGDHRFTRLNPAAGATYALGSDVTAYGSISVSSRVPAPSELSCADPEDPCRLPNAFVADPPLEQVVARTWEGGVRGRRPSLSWNASLFHTANSNDIMFVSSGPLTNTGHFENIGDTVRQGIELGASGTARMLRWSGAYSYVRARFDTPLTLSSPNHPEAQDGEIAVAAGDRIPGVPQHNIKASLSSTIRRLSLGGSVVAMSSQYLRGDEANLLSPLEGFSTVNVVASYALSKQVAIQGRLTNLFDVKSSNFGVLGDATDVLGDQFDDPRFVSPNAPRAAWVGLEVAFR